MARLAFGLVLLLVGTHSSSAQGPHPVGFVNVLLFNHSLR